jgi:hypothetical protein
MLTQTRVQELFEYHPDCGAFIRKSNRHLVEGAAVTIDGKKYELTHVIWLHYYGVWPKALVDHKNRIRADTSITNLREATHQQNGFNLLQFNPTGLKGIYNCGRKSKPWQAQIRINGKKVNLGRFATQEEAAEAYRQAAAQHHGEFACLS